jgi:two-component system, NarL family, nitrate/nitrite response regulator NarL
VASPVRVLIVDDDCYARDALHSLISRDVRTRVSAAADSIAEALSALASLDGPQPDVIVLDVRLAEGERAGIEAIPTLREAAPGARILVTSVSADDNTVLAAVRAGADGYVWKNETAERIVLGITAVAEGRFVLSRTIAEHLLDRIADLGTYATEVVPDGPAARDLTEAVRKTLYLYCVMGLSAREVAEELQVSVNTVNSRIKAAYLMLGARNRAEAFRCLVEGTGHAGTTGAEATAGTGGGAR